MSSFHLAFIFFFVLGACSKQSPHIETKKEILQEDKRNITEAQASMLLDAPLNAEDLKTALLKIEQFHKLDFSFELFWRSLRFPQVDISKFDGETISMLEALGAKSCARGASESYLQFILNLSEVHPKVYTVNYLKLIGQHLVQCAPKHRAEFTRSFFKGVTTIVSADMNFDSINASLPVFNSLVSMGDLQLSKEISNFFERQMLKKAADYIYEKNDIESAIAFSTFIKRIHPLDQRLMLIPLEGFVSGPEQVESMVSKLDFEDSSLLLKRLRDLLPFNATSVQPFVSTYVNKIERHFSLATLDDENSVAFATALTEAASIYADFNKDPVLNLSLIESLAKKLVSQVKDIRALKSLSSDSLVVATALGKEMAIEELSSIKLPSASDEVSQVVRHFLQIRTGQDHLEKKKKLKKICDILPKKSIRSIKDVQGPGCYKLTDAPKKLVVEEDLELPFFSSIEAPIEKLVIKSNRLSLGIVDLSNRTVPAIVKSPITPASADAVVVPLLIGLSSTEKKGIFRPGSNYYFFYHFVYRYPQIGPALDDDQQPASGLPGGSVYVPESSFSRFSFVSFGSEGQKAPAPAKGGKGSEFYFNESDFDLWIAEFINVESYLLTKNFRTEDNLKLLTRIGKRNEEMRLIGLVDPNYMTILSQEQRTTLEQNLVSVNNLEGWRCPDLECMLQKVSTLAMKEFAGLLEQENYPQVLNNMEPNFVVNEGPKGVVATDGERGNDGKIITSTSF